VERDLGRTAVVAQRPVAAESVGQPVAELARDVVGEPRGDEVLVDGKLSEREERP
jgi:hypothetical protein